MKKKVTSSAPIEPRRRARQRTQAHRPGETLPPAEHDALRESEERFRAIFDSTFQFTGLITPDGTLIEANRAALDFAGISRKDVINKPFWEARWWRGNEARVQHLKEAVVRSAGGEFVRYEVELQGAGDTTMIIDFSLKPVFGSDGKVTLLVPEGRDITGQKKAAAALLLSENRHRALIDHIPQRIFIKDKDSIYVSCNAHFAADVAVAQEQVAGKDDFAFFPAEMAHTYRADDRECMASGKAKDIEEVYQIAGVKRWAHTIKVPYRDGRGNIAGVMGVYEDITARKMAAEELQKAHDALERRVAERTADLRASNALLKDEIKAHHLADAALRRSEERYRRVTETMTDYLYSVRIQEDGTRVRTHNPACERMTGYSVEDLDEDPLLWRDLIPVEDRELVADKVNKMLSSGKFQTFEHRIVRKDGTVRWVSTMLLPDVDATGKVVSFDGTLKDITERKQAEADVRRHWQELYHMERVHNMGQLAASLAHEINQPLAGILSNAQAAQRFLARDEQDLGLIREILGDIVADDKHIAEIIQRLRALLRKEEVGREPVDVNDIAQSVLMLVRAETVRQRMSLRTMLAEGPLLVCADPIQIEQVIINLIMNAISAAEDVPLQERHIVVATERDVSGGAKISVTDNGSGIDKDKLQMIFEPFYTTKAGGLGVGLSISRSIVNAHDGRIWAENNSDRGARFCVLLPAAETK